MKKPRLLAFKCLMKASPSIKPLPISSRNCLRKNSLRSFKYNSLLWNKSSFNFRSSKKFLKKIKTSKSLGISFVYNVLDAAKVCNVYAEIIERC
jgi:hypothetical protein